MNNSSSLKYIILYIGTALIFFFTSFLLIFNIVSKIRQNKKEQAECNFKCAKKLVYELGRYLSCQNDEDTFNKNNDTSSDDDEDQ